MRYVAVTGVRFSITEAGRRALRESEHTPRAQQTPLPLLPEFSDSRDEPNGPVSIAPLAVVVHCPTIGILHLALLLDGDSWSRRDFRAFEKWRDYAMRSQAD